MIKFVSIAAFRKRLSGLLKVKRGVYGGIKSEICRAFNGFSIEQICANRDMILVDNESVVIKLRLPDKKQRLSKSDGYRLIYMVMKHISVVIFLDIYPKNGPLQQIDIEDNELNRLLLNVVEEFNAGSLVLHSIENELIEL